MIKNIEQSPGSLAPVWSPDFDFFRNLDERTEERIYEKLDRYQQMIEIRGGCSNIPNWRIKDTLMRVGQGCFAERDGKLHLLVGNIGGELDENYLYTKYLCSNPYIPGGSFELEIDKDCVLARNDHMMRGILPLLRRYAYMQAHTELSMYMAAVNCRATVLGISGRDAEAEAYKAVMLDIEKGKATALSDRNILQNFKTTPFAGNAGVLTDLIEFYQYIKASEANDLGLQANWNAKRESLTASETLLNTDTLMTFVSDMKECWEDWAKKVNQKYGALLDEGPYEIVWKDAWKVNAKETEARDIELDAEEAQSEVDAEAPAAENVETEEEKGSVEDGKAD